MFLILLDAWHIKAPCNVLSDDVPPILCRAFHGVNTKPNPNSNPNPRLTCATRLTGAIMLTGATRLTSDGIIICNNAETDAEN